MVSLALASKLKPGNCPPRLAAGKVVLKVEGWRVAGAATAASLQLLRAGLLGCWAGLRRSAANSPPAWLWNTPRIQAPPSFQASSEWWPQLSPSLFPCSDDRTRPPGQLHNRTQFSNSQFCSWPRGQRTATKAFPKRQPSIQPLPFLQLRRIRWKQDGILPLRLAAQ
jgi:hypothetical protein